jgi:hypothetical protein
MLCDERSNNTYQFHSLYFNLTGLETAIYSSRGNHSNHYTTDAFLVSHIGRLTDFIIKQSEKKRKKKKKEETHTQSNKEAHIEKVK